MRVFAIVAAITLAFLSACSGSPSEPDHQAEWRDVLRHKKAASEPGAPPERRQAWADAVRAFVEKHPNHERARQVWQRLQLEFADELVRIGRHAQAIAFYRAVLAHDPGNEHAAIGMERASAAMLVTREELAGIVKGMRQREVASLLGRPMPGWSTSIRRRGVEFEAWYYRTPRGVAAVHFRAGKVIAVEEASSSRNGTVREPVRPGRVS